MVDAGNRLGRETMAKRPVVKPGQDYLAVTCVKCSQQFPVEIPAKVAKDRPSGPIQAECPFCNHKASYRPDQVKRMTGSHEE